MTRWIDDHFADLAVRGHRFCEHNQGTVYCFSEGPGYPVKFGFTRNLEIRWRGIACATWRPLQIAWTCEGILAHENALKYIFDDQRVIGEWFSDERDAIKFGLPVSAETHQLEDFICIEAEKRRIPTVRERAPRRPGLVASYMPRPAVRATA